MSLDSIFNAKSVAVIGASRNETKRGYQAIRALIAEGYEGSVFPVNPKEKRILGLPCYPRVSEIPEAVDLALITTPARTIPGVLEDCGRKNVSGAVVVAGGFAEIGSGGKQLEAEMQAAAETNRIRIVGPNTSGLMNLHTGMNLAGIRNAPKGDIALITQSGNMALALITEAMIKSRKGFSYYVGVGNESDIHFHEYLEFFQHDPNTRCILMYVEGMRQGREFLQRAYKTSLEKPIIMLKGGRSLTGKRSAGSHTGALAGMSRVARGALERAGIIVIENSDELFPAAETMSILPHVKNNQVAILADGGGHATIAADLLTDLGVEIPPLSEKTQNKLKEILPEAASVANPVDVAGGTDADPTLFAECADIILKDHGVGGLLLVGLFGGYGIRFAERLALMEEDAAHQMGKQVQKRKKPIVVHSLFSSAKPHSLGLLQYYGIPVYDSLDVAVKCIGVLAKRGDYLKSYHAKVNFVLNWREKARPQGQELVRKAMLENRNFLLEHESKQLLALHGVAVSSDFLATSPEEAVRFAKAADGPVVMKIVSPDILHKSDVGGVRLGLTTESEVRKAYDEILDNVKGKKPAADIRGILLAPMAKPGLEVIIGTKIDDQFGPVIMFGLGGVMVEVLKDVSFRVLPIGSMNANWMMKELKSSPLLDGFRGFPPRDKKALKRLLVTCSELMEAYPEIKEMDLNPVMAYEEGIEILDARILL